MIVDPSAMLAVVLAEEDAERYARAMHSARDPLISVANYREIAVRVDRAEQAATLHRFDTLMELTGLTIAPVSIKQATLARRAYTAIGKGRHPAGLNMGAASPMRLRERRSVPCRSRGTISPGRISPPHEQACRLCGFARGIPPSARLKFRRKVPKLAVARNGSLPVRA